MKLIFLGTGTSTGVPSLCCDCLVCRSDDARNKRLRSSLLVVEDGHHILIDTSTDLRQQCLLNGVGRIDSVLYTHHHADHVHGIDELRSFSHFNGIRVPCYGNRATLDELRKNFSYIFRGGVQTGGGLPNLELLEAPGEGFRLGGVRVLPLDILHGGLTILGYRLNDVAYITDCSGLPDETLDRLAGLDLLILNAVGFEPHPTHFCLSDALKAVEAIRPRQALLTHINHKFDHETVSRGLPENVALAHDGLCVEF